MRRKQTQHIGEILKEFINVMKISRKMNEMRVINGWENLVGKQISKYTSQVSIKNRTLFVSLTSSVIRNELFLHREQLLKNINESAGMQLIEQIVLR